MITMIRETDDLWQKKMLIHFDVDVPSPQREQRKHNWFKERILSNARKLSINPGKMSGRLNSIQSPHKVVGLTLNSKDILKRGGLL